MGSEYIGKPVTNVRVHYQAGGIPLSTSTSAYGPCPSCGGLNMAGRRNCYRCGKPLPTNFWLVCEQNTRGEIESYRPGFSETRRFPRYEVQMPLELGGATLPEQIVTLRNVSLGGVQFLARQDYRLGSRVWIYVPLKERQVHLLQGVVRYTFIRHLGSARIFTCGVEFQESQTQTIRVISSLLERVQGRHYPELDLSMGVPLF